MTVLRWLRAQITRRPRRINGRWYFWTRRQYAVHDRLVTRRAHDGHPS